MEYIERLLRHNQAEGLAHTTITDRGELLLRVERDLPYGLIGATSDELTDWLAQFPGRQTKATYRIHLNAFYQHWSNPRRRPHLDFNPMEDVPKIRVPRRTPRPVSEDTLAYALAHLDRWPALAVRLAAQAGMRCCEMAEAARADFDPDEIVLRGKGGTVKTVTCHPDIWSAVRDLPPGPIFTTKRGARVTAHHISARLSEALTGIGLVGVTAHRFRHRFGTRINEYVDTRTAQEFLRHESITSTAIYTAVGRNQRAAAIRALDVATAS